MWKVVVVVCKPSRCHWSALTFSNPYISKRNVCRSNYRYDMAPDAGASLEWFEGFAAMPLYYLLSATRSRRTPDVRDFHAIGAYAGPAVSTIDGRRELGDTKIDFEQSDLAGAVGGIDLWLLSNLRFGGRLEYFGDCAWSLSCEYSF